MPKSKKPRNHFQRTQFPSPISIPRMRNPSSASARSNDRVSGKATTPCCSKVGLKRGPWTPEEDELLSAYINREGEGRWRTLPKRAGLLRCGKSCRLRWMNYLRPSVKRGQIAPDEEDLILRLHRLLGNRWSLIAGRIPGRTDNEIKNYWNTHLSKKLISQGIDPRTHKPLNPDPSSHADAATVPPAPKPNPNPNFSSLEEMGRGEYFQGVRGDNGTTRLPTDEGGTSSEMMMMGLQGSGGNNSNQDDEMECCTDDIFSSFLNSLINEDMSVQQQQQQMNLTAPKDPLVNYGAIWDEQHEHGRFVDRGDKHL